MIQQLKSLKLRKEEEELSLSFVLLVLLNLRDDNYNKFRFK